MNWFLRLGLPSDSTDSETYFSLVNWLISPQCSAAIHPLKAHFSYFFSTFYFFPILTDGWEPWVAVVQHLPGLAAALGSAQRHRWRYGGGAAWSAVVGSPPRSGWNAFASDQVPQPSSLLYIPTSDEGPVLWIIKSEVELPCPCFRHIKLKYIYMIFFVSGNMHLLC